MRRRIGMVARVLRRAVDRSREDGVATSAQAVAYSLFLAIPAAMLVTLGTFSLVADENLVRRLIERVAVAMPAEAATLLEESLTRSTQSNTGGIVMTALGFLLALWTTTSAATTLMSSVSSAYGRDDRRSFVRKRLVALFIVAVLVAGAALVVGLLVLGPHLERWTGAATGAPTLTAWIWWSAQWPVLVVGLLLAFAVVLAVAPGDSERRLALVLPGAVIALVAWLAASGVFAVYSANFGSYEKTWGTLSAVVATLVWLWLTSAALLFGAEVNAAADELADELADEHADGNERAERRTPRGRVTPAARGTPAQTTPSPRRASGRAP